MAALFASYPKTDVDLLEYLKQQYSESNHYRHIDPSEVYEPVDSTPECYLFFPLTLHK